MSIYNGFWEKKNVFSCLKFYLSIHKETDTDEPGGHCSK